MNNKEKTITYFCFYPKGTCDCKGEPAIFIRHNWSDKDISLKGIPSDNLIKELLQSKFDIDGWCEKELDLFKEWVVENRKEVMDEINGEEEIIEEDVSPVALEYVKEMKKNGTWNPEKEKAILKWGAAIKKSTDETLKMQRDLLERKLENAGDAPPETVSGSIVECGSDATGFMPCEINFVAHDSVINIKDDVNHPTHYKNHPSGVECIDITEHMSFCLGNAVKYIWRCEEKHNDGGEKDLKKAIWYLNRELKRRFNKGEE